MDALSYLSALRWSPALRSYCLWRHRPALAPYQKTAASWPPPCSPASGHFGPLLVERSGTFPGKTAPHPLQQLTSSPGPRYHASYSISKHRREPSARSAQAIAKVYFNGPSSRAEVDGAIEQARSNRAVTLAALGEILLVIVFRAIKIGCGQNLRHNRAPETLF